MSIEELKKDLRNITTEELYDKYIVSGTIWYFESRYSETWYEKYDQFRLFISKKLDVHYNDIAVAGSAKLGFSLNPNKDFKMFDNDSDIDVIIISQKYFYLFWDAYRRDSYAFIRTPSFDKICFSVFRKYLSPYDLDKKNTDYLWWIKKTQGFEKNLQLEFDIENDIHYRIFESWDAAKDYYMSSLNKMKRKMEGIDNADK